MLRHRSEIPSNGICLGGGKSLFGILFDHYDEDEIIATVSDDNTASCKTAEKAGFQLSDTRMYKDIYDPEERLYRFYAAKRAVSDRAESYGIRSPTFEGKERKKRSSGISGGGGLLSPDDCRTCESAD